MEWKKILSTLNAFNIRVLILQWSRYDVVNFMNNKEWLEEILKEANNQNIQVIIGLYSDNKYFKNIENKGLDLSTYFNRLYKINLQQAKQVYIVAKTFPNFLGWYFTEEVDDLNFKDKTKEKALKLYWMKLSNEIKKVANRPIYLSGFYAKNSSPKEYVTMLNRVVPRGAYFFLQSGVGAKLVKLEESKNYMKQFQMSYRGQFIPVVELFTIEKKEIRAMEFNSIKRQIECCKNDIKSSTVALFSLRYFFTNELLKGYRKDKLLKR